MYKFEGENDFFATFCALIKQDIIIKEIIFDLRTNPKKVKKKYLKLTRKKMNKKNNFMIGKISIEMIF